MGQFLCATPLIRSLLILLARRSLHFLGNPVNAAAAEKNPRLNRVWVWHKTALWEWTGQIRNLRKEHFDLALLLNHRKVIRYGGSSGARYRRPYGGSVLLLLFPETRRKMPPPFAISAFLSEGRPMKWRSSSALPERLGVPPQGRGPKAGAIPGG